MEYLETEIAALDAMLGGGIPRGKTVLVCGPHGTGKSILSMQIAFKSVLNGQRLIIINFEKNAMKIVKKMNEFGWDFKKHPRSIYFVDCSGNEEVKNDHINLVKNPSDPNKVLEKLDFVLEKEPDWGGIILVDDVSTLMVNSSPAEAFKFMRALQNKVNNGRGVAIAILQKGIFDEKDEKLIEHATDGTIETFFESPRKLAVKRMESSKINESKISYTVTGKGITFNIG
ncbi:MAG: AAA family ATPase [Candidatus Diapherotrites archaeon]|nr:AAA family ATPase [Candidatus Diapherotrites archaeon]